MIFTKVDGSPYQVGDVVRVVSICDDAGDRGAIGSIGVVDHLDYDSGCGETYPDDPMISVKGCGIFWSEELETAEEEDE